MAKVPFEDEYAAFVAKVKVLLGGDKSYSGFKAPTVETPSNRWESMIRYTDYSIEQHWCSGGIGGGSCWNDGESDTHYEMSGDPPPATFEDLNTVLEAFWPNISFLQYQKYIVPLFRNEERTESEYYGNCTRYAYKIISLRDMFVVFNENGILPV